jgi:hypothetical protein
MVLEVFLASEYDVDQALDKLRLSSTKKNLGIVLIDDEMQLISALSIILVYSNAWSLTECEQFEQCFKVHGKDFYLFKVDYCIRTSYLQLLVTCSF